MGNKMVCVQMGRFTVLPVFPIDSDNVTTSRGIIHYPKKNIAKNYQIEYYMTSYMHLSQSDNMANGIGSDLTEKIDADNQRFPYCIVWTPIPLLTWLVSIV